MSAVLVKMPPPTPRKQSNRAGPHRETADGAYLEDAVIVQEIGTADSNETQAGNGKSHYGASRKGHV